MKYFNFGKKKEKKKKKNKKDGKENERIKKEIEGNGKN
jgi:hypothetical protein